MTVKPSRSLFNPLNVLTGLVIVVILFAGIGFTTDNLQNADIREILEDNRKAGDDRTEQLKQLENLTGLAIQQNDAIIKIQEAQGNISDDARARIINNMETILPALNQTVQHINEQFDNHSEQVKRHDQSLKDAIKILEVPQSNFTAQKIAIANIEKVLENQEEILQRLNSSLS